MKTYKDFEKIYIGSSDTASLVMVGCDRNGRLISEFLNFGEDAVYTAYLVEGDVLIGAHYSEVATFYSWLKIYDDEELTFNKRGNFKIYRAGAFGCIIQEMGD